ncbi:Methyl-CpG-binding domain protein 4 [Fulvia fulva]|uniref:Methyl-CpG-binding domain protein 4 n=1 Tax=Passalora fulva TaxID=5499 RepID=A0A9Q8PHH7_PASFU|nr:Methyl-CpG-binding domain protein 4 [Fulvia fulva]KAK4615596.1 Methyl-CpG-binding domain protein 4 [Fulvia fulva]KAK4616961.1 Methyl-CpG-binding domain protein 4 [Fulvia fulva]UJO22505.1 Methyl-CpG-binding domain protein 4 [Fulvia fulva]WPV19674.1 Methyl-CpG-binding domain protein 4 [Fulvia fulva]WPV34173.1 Methyl-CpG-binding domain protein 4 [Fulvia fulva]
MSTNTTNNKRKAPPTSSNNPTRDEHEHEYANKRLKLTNHAHPGRTPVLHRTGDGVAKSLDFIDFATVVVDSITAGHAPDILTAKGARKRWRDEMKARAVEVQRGRDGTGRGEEVKQVKDSRITLGEKRPALDVGMIARTRLARPPVKEWHVTDAPPQCAIKPDPGIKEESEEVKQVMDGIPTVEEKRPALDVKVLARTRLARPPVKEWHVTDEQPRRATKPDPGIKEEPEEVAPTVDQVCVDTREHKKAPEATIATARRSEQRRPSPPRRVLPTYRPPGLKKFTDLPLPNRGPPQLDDSDDSSESESDSSDDEDETASKAPVQGSVSESFADRIFTTEKEDSDRRSGDTLDLVESSNSREENGQTEIPGKQQSERPLGSSYGSISNHASEFGEIVCISDAGKARNANIEQPATSSSQPKSSVPMDAALPTPLATPTGTSHDHSKSASQQTDNATKKTMRTGKAGSKRSGRGRSSARSDTLAEISPDCLRTRQELFATDGDSDDVYDDIEDVTEDLLSESLLSMDQCKPPNSRDSACEVDLDMLMTANDSVGKVPSERDAVVMMVHDDGRSFDAWALDDTDVMQAMYEGRADGGALQDAEGAVADQVMDDAAVKLDLSRTSSSLSSTLSELGRAPTPPTVDVQDTEIAPAISPEASANSEAAMPVSCDSSKVLVPLRRKMTGISSKHFSPAKITKTTNLDRLNRQTPMKGREAVVAADTESPLTALQNALDRQVFPSEDVAADEQAESANNLLENSESVNASVPVNNPAAGTSKRKKSSRRRQRKVDDVGVSTIVDEDQEYNQSGTQADNVKTPVRQTRSTVKTPASKRKSTGKISEHFITDRVDLYNTTAGGGRIPAGTSRAPVPPIDATMFGLIQEKIWREPFWLIIAVTFLNKTAGRSAVPVFWKLKEKYPTCEALAEADQADLLEMVRHLGLQNQRSKRLIQIAKAWTADPPVAGKRYRTLNYPTHGDGKASTIANLVEEDAEDCAGLLEIGNIPGCGQYAYDSWRIFCRDHLRGVADDYNGTNAKIHGFVPEWQRVLPDDKELRACLRWMWLREGWIWDPLSGEKRRASEEEMEKAILGEMEIEDPQERKFAAQAAGVESSAKKVKRGGADRSLEETPAKTRSRPSANDDQIGAEVLEDVCLENDASAIDVAPPTIASSEAASKARRPDAQASIEESKAKHRKRGRQRKSIPVHASESAKPRRSARHQVKKSST